MTSRTTRTIDHPILGKLSGRVSGDSKTVQYRNIKYANIPRRWQDPVLYSGPLGTDNLAFDATVFGPSCPQKPENFKNDLSMIGDLELELEDAAKEVDEFQCLNLVVTVPNISTSGEEGDGKLPVMVWLHGGGFFAGSNSWPQYDLSNLVQTSTELGKPIIGISINYRLGVLGFLASDELGINGNYGLKDQECAFKWIQQHIEGFGGNPTNITAFGESAGSISLSTLLHTSPSTHLFNRAILMSGDPTIRRPRDMAWQNSQYNSLTSYLSLTDLTPESRADFFRNAPANELISKVPPGGHWSPTIDGEFVKYDITLGILSDPNDDRGKPDWCEEILVGDAQHDATCLHGRVMALPTAVQLSRLHGTLERTFSTSQYEKVLANYSLTPMHQAPADTLAGSHSQFYDGILEIASDLRFHLPTLKLAEGYASYAPAGTDRTKQKNKTTKCLRYQYHQLNPHVNTLFSDYAGHEQELAFILQNFPCLSSFTSSEKSPPREVQEKAAEFGKKIAQVWIVFANGEGVHIPRDSGVASASKPQPQGEADDKVLVIGPNFEFKSVDDESYDREYRKGRARTLWEHIPWQKWFELGEKLQGC